MAALTGVFMPSDQKKSQAKPGNPRGRVNDQQEQAVESGEPRATGPKSVIDRNDAASKKDEKNSASRR
jgi:hypothetical protein